MKQAINTTFIKEWQPFEQVFKKVRTAIYSHFANGMYQWQPTNSTSSKRHFSPLAYSQINSALGLAYTSTGACAGLWICNSGYLWASDTHYFIGFAINELGELVGVAHDSEENEIFVLIKKL